MPEMTDTQARQCAAFLQALRRTGNVRMAAEEAGVYRQTFDKRRNRWPDFASAWDAAVSFAVAHLLEAGAVAPRGDAAVTSGGEYSVRATRGRRMQVRRAKPGLLTPAGERIFLAHLAATANVRLSAAATGIGWNAVYARRQTSATFAREMEVALAEGYQRLEFSLLANALASLESDGTDLAGWREDSDVLPDPLTRMSTTDALLLLGYRRGAIVAGRPHASTKLRVTEQELNVALLKRMAQLKIWKARKARDAKRNRAPAKAGA